MIQKFYLYYMRFLTHTFILNSLSPGCDLYFTTRFLSQQNILVSPIYLNSLLMTLTIVGILP